MMCKHSSLALALRQTVSAGLLITLCCCGTPVVRQFGASINNATTSGTTPTGVAKPLEFVYAAAPLSGAYVVDSSSTPVFPSAVTTQTGAVNFVSSAIADSMVRCQNFVNSITAGQALQNTTFDIISIVTSALATVFVPANTVRALAASSTISQGTKGAVNGDFFQTLTTQILAQKIKDIYYSKLDDYRDNKMPSQGINAAKEYTKIVEIHSNCSIPAAIGALTTTPSFSPPISTVLTSVVPGAMYKLNNGTYATIIQNSDKTLSAQAVDQSGKPIGTGTLIQNLSQANMLIWLKQMQAVAVPPKSTS